MRISLVLVTLFLVMKLRSTQSRCEEPGSRRPLSDPSLVNRRNIARRSSDLDYDSFVGLMGRRNTEAANELPSANKREMHDIFVGLMGRRNSETGVFIAPADDGPWRKTDPERRGVFLNKCRLRFRRGF
ncbi:tachykinin-3a isoform X1 [Gadus chalcogrammus]|uniref:tachykinin-3a isoform X1 n=1 Tax=Gadus chalcogrammus TaxID=1042646 RepID=UPI0024C373E0|nr:tachykinin-3a isoform X1 [Gadus chalcogrammus]